MTKRMINAFAVTLIAVLALFVIGCQPAPVGDNGNDNVPAPATVEATAEMTEAATEAPTEMATVEVTEAATAEATDDGAAEAPTPAVLDEETASGTTAETIATDERFGVFGQILSQIVASGMMPDVDLQNAEFTLFVPNEEVEVTQDDFTAVASDAAAAESFFGCYVAEGSMSLQDLLDAGEVTTVSGETLTITSEEEGIVLINDEAQIVSVIATSNGYIYLINDLVCDPAE
jgi:uncharacterized surface protein with fasciclin (FAS1) repeats